MSFGLSKTTGTEEVPERAYKDRISLIASGGNDCYSSRHCTFSNKYAISVGSSTFKYNPWEENESGSNYGKGNADLWAPGKNSKGLNTAGYSTTGKGTSFSAVCVSGILATFYGVDGKDMTPERALARLFQNADDYMDFPSSQNWKGSPNILMNTGHLKGQQQSPNVPHIGGPPIAEPGPFLCTFGADPGFYTGSGGYCQCGGTALYRHEPQLLAL